ncbi:hypothetical protein C0991_009911 [Blastosporella zonata]|nr:hypothetical protein C0991_009911 [Blastosporella zonata]
MSSKKKPKQKTGQTAATNAENSRTSAPPDLRAIVEDLVSIGEESALIPVISPSNSLFSAIDDFIRLTSLPQVKLDLLISVTLRTVEALAEQINNILCFPSPCAPTEPNTLERLGFILHHVLAMSLPSLEQLLAHAVEPIIALLDKTTRLVLIPVIHTFQVRSETYLGSLFLSLSGGATPGILKLHGPHQTLHTDIRINMLDLFRKIFWFLDGRLQSCSTLQRHSLVSHTFRASLILETIREIDRVLSISLNASGFDRGVDAKRYKIERAKKLAQKDSLWYLCTVLHLLFGESTESVGVASQPVTVSLIFKARFEKNNGTEAGDEVENDIQGGGARLLSEGISNTLLQLISRCTRPSSSSSQLPKSGDMETQRTRTASPRNNTRSHSGVESTTEGRGNVGPRGTAHGDTGRRECGGRMRADVGVDVDADVCVNAAGQRRDDSGSDQFPGSVPQEPNSSDQPSPDHDGRIILDEVGYGMLLGVLERYWVWTKSWEL